MFGDYLEINANHHLFRGLFVIIFYFHCHSLVFSGKLQATTFFLVIYCNKKYDEEEISLNYKFHHTDKLQHSKSTKREVHILCSRYSYIHGLKERVKLPGEIKSTRPLRVFRKHQTIIKCRHCDYSICKPSIHRLGFPVSIIIMHSFFPIYSFHSQRSLNLYYLNWISYHT